MRINKFRIIEAFTMSFCIGGVVAVTVGTVAIIGSVVALRNAFCVITNHEPLITKAARYGDISITTGLAALVIATGVARYTVDNLYLSLIEEEKFSSKTHKCNSCQYFHGYQYNNIDLICAVYPSGVEGDSCPGYQHKRD